LGLAALVGAVAPIGAGRPHLPDHGPSSVLTTGRRSHLNPTTFISQAARRASFRRLFLLDGRGGRGDDVPRERWRSPEGATHPIPDPTSARLREAEGSSTSIRSRETPASSLDEDARIPRPAGGSAVACLRRRRRRVRPGGTPTGNKQPTSVIHRGGLLNVRSVGTGNRNREHSSRRPGGLPTRGPHWPVVDLTSKRSACPCRRSACRGWTPPGRPPRRRI
jgi:hypothetical protein